MLSPFELNSCLDKILRHEITTAQLKQGLEKKNSLLFVQTATLQGSPPEDGEDEGESKGSQQPILFFVEAEIYVHVEPCAFFRGRDLEAHKVKDERARPLLMDVGN